MKKLLFFTIFISLLLSADIEKEIGRYQLETITYTSKKGRVYIVETVLDTKTGKVVVRRRNKASSYKLPYKNRYNKMIHQE